MSVLHAISSVIYKCIKKILSKKKKSALKRQIDNVNSRTYEDWLGYYSTKIMVLKSQEIDWQRGYKVSKIMFL